MFRRLGRAVQRRRWWIIASWVALIAISLPLAPRLTSTLKPGGFASPNLESAQATKVIEERLGQHADSLIAVFQTARYTVDDPRFAAAVERNLSPLRGLPGIARVVAPADNPRQISADRHTAYAVITFDPNSNSGRDLISAVQQHLKDDELTVLVSGAPVFYSDIEAISERDLRRAELVAFPLGLFALVLVLRSVVAAALPVVVGGASVIAALATLFLVGQAVDLSIFVLNMATMLGLGLSIDYALFLTNRFREELKTGPSEEAVETAVSTAGKAVLFSALTVLSGLLGLLTFDSMMLRSLGVAGAVIVSLAALAALTLLPALLAVLGTRVNRFAFPALPVPRRLSWAAFSLRVMRHPMAIALPVLVFLLLLGSPFLRVRLSAPDASILPSEMPSRRGFETLRAEFGEGQVSPVLVVVQTEGDVFLATNIAKLYDFTHRLRADPRVSHVQSIVDLDPRLTKEQYQLLYADGEHLSDPYARETARALARGDTTLIAVASRYPMIAPESQDLVRSIRAGPPSSFRVLVGGSTAAAVDYVADLYSTAPRAVALVALATYLTLFLLFRSVVLPLKAIIMNILSLLASYGALVAVFQEGTFSGMLGFAPAGFVEASLPIVMFCFLFGVSMDYEVFLLTRIKESYERTRDNVASVAEGLEHSGRIITGAAAIVVVVSASFAAADIVLIKALGLGTAIAVFLDATVVRALLVPATMRMLGALNWWLPRAPLLNWRALRFATAALIVVGVSAAILWFGDGYDTPERLTTGNAGAEAAIPQRTLPPIALPADEAPHDDLTEWWYYTGHLTAADGRTYGFEFVVFQSVRADSPAGYASHLAITDHARQAFRYDQRSAVGRLEQGGQGFNLALGNWQMRGANGHDQLRAATGGYGFEIDLRATKPPALHSGTGIVSFGPAGDSYYYSRTRMAATGTLVVDGVTSPIRGDVWMDHQWGNFLVLRKGGWDWFGLQLDDGSELAISIVRPAPGVVVPAYGTYVDAAGKALHLPATAFAVDVTSSWPSPRSGATYPAAWVISIPELRLSMRVEPVLPDQELDTRQTTGVTYWEGEVAIDGTRDGRAVTGRGYVELTGYASVE